MLIPVLVRLEPEAKSAIDRLSREDGASIAHHFRKAVDLYLAKKGCSTQQGATEKVGFLKDQ